MPSHSVDVAASPGKVPWSRGVWLCAPGWGQARGQVSPVPARPSAAAALGQRGTRDSSSKKTWRQEILAVPARLSRAGTSLPQKLCQTFLSVLSQCWLCQLSPPPRPQRAWNRRAPRHHPTLIKHSFPIMKWLLIYQPLCSSLRIPRCTAQPRCCLHSGLPWCFSWGAGRNH